jgi:hypothetical protein
MKAIASRIERLERTVGRVAIEVVTGVPDRPPVLLYVPATTVTEARLKAIGAAHAPRR